MRKGFVIKWVEFPRESDHQDPGFVGQLANLLGGEPSGEDFATGGKDDFEVLEDGALRCVGNLPSVEKHEQFTTIGSG